MPASDAAGLSGLWSGWYAYDAGGDRVPFTALIEEAGEGFSGTTLEPNTFAPEAGEDLAAEITGFRRGDLIDFIKTYLMERHPTAEPISYAGKVDRAFTLIRGEWAIQADWTHVTGDFELSRVSANQLTRQAADTQTAPSPR